MKKLVSILMILAMIVPMAGGTIDGHLQEKEEKEEQDGSGG